MQRDPERHDGLALELMVARIVIPPVFGGIAVMLHGIPVHRFLPAERRSQLAGTLSGGEQQMLAIGRGIASSPQLLLLDEPSMGLAPAIADLIFDRITALHREDGVTLLLVEQRVAEALESCDYGYVLETGRVVLEGTHRTLTADDRVRRAYLGM
jgi:branched-chain amino acid transport system ATP-binding protein